LNGAKQRLLLVLPLVAAAHVALVLSSAAHKSMTYDELAHIAGGLAYWEFADYRFHPENGMLAQRIAALPLQVLPINFPDFEERVWKTSNVWGFGHRIMYRDNDFPHTMLRLARLGTLFVSVIFGTYLALTIGRYWGAAAAVAAGAIYWFSPTVVAHARLATSDLIAAAFFTWFCLSWLYVLQRRTFVSAIVAGVALAGAGLSKYSFVLLGPLMAMMILCWSIYAGWARRESVSQKWSIRKSGRTFSRLLGLSLICGATAILLVWAAYGFRFGVFNPEIASNETTLFRSWRTITEPLGFIKAPFAWIRTYQLLPEGFLYGFGFVVSAATARRAFFGGEYSLDGWLAFFPFLFATKTALSILGLFALGLSAMVLSLLDGLRKHFVILIPLGLLAAIFGVAAITSNLNIGHRHILVLYPILAVIGAWSFFSAGRWARGRRIVGAALILVLIAETVMIWPHHLSFFNRLVVGPAEAYRYVVDSSVDWGQDLPSLREKLEQLSAERGQSERVYLSYFGTASPTAYGIEARRLPSYAPLDETRVDLRPLEGGLYAVSVTMLQRVYLDCFGPWDARREEVYVELRKLVREVRQAGAERREQIVAGVGGFERFTRLSKRYADFRFGRLCLYLERQTPVARAGYSILIYELSEEDLQRALDGPPAEWVSR